MAYKKTVWVEGQTPLSPRNFNNMESGIWDAYWQSGATPLANATTTLVKDEQGNLMRVDEVVEGVLRRQTILHRVNGRLDHVVGKIFAEDGITVLREYVVTLTMSTIVKEVIV